MERICTWVCVVAHWRISLSGCTPGEHSDVWVQCSISFKKFFLKKFKKHYKKYNADIKGFRQWYYLYEKINTCINWKFQIKRNSLNTFPVSTLIKKNKLRPLTLTTHKVSFKLLRNSESHCWSSFSAKAQRLKIHAELNEDIFCYIKCINVTLDILFSNTIMVFI